jgi:DNA processing protein
MLKGRDIIVYLAIKYQGDWNAIYQAIKNKEMVDEPTVNETLAKEQAKVVTIIDEDYPERLKRIYKPPFVLFYYGKLDTLQYRKSLGIYAEKLTEYSLSTSQNILGQVNADTTMIMINNDGSPLFSRAVDHNVTILHSSIRPLQSGEKLVIGEYPSDTGGAADLKNWAARLIVGLSDVVFLPETKAKVAKITAGYSAYLNKQVAIVPQQANSKNISNQLIQENIAKVVLHGKDILAMYNDLKDPSSLPNPEHLKESGIN